MLRGDGNSIYKLSLVSIVKFICFDFKFIKLNNFFNLYLCKDVECFKSF